MGLWCPKSTVLHILLNISKSSPLNFKNNPIFGIYVKFAIDWWYSFTYLVKNSLRKRLSKIEELKKKIRFFENHPGVKGLIRHIKNNFFCQKMLDLCELCPNQDKNAKIEKKCDFSILRLTL